MSIKNLETKKCRGRASKLSRFLHREGKKYCAVALCASLIAGNLGSSAVAADESTVHEFGLDRVALYEALQEAVMADEIVDGAFTFAGEAADTYDSLFNSEGNGNLYELKPEIEDNGGALSLRIFARLDGEIEFDSAYEIDGTEEMIFLLTNTSKEEKTAVISVDGKKTEEIKVAPKSAVLSDEELEAYNSAAEQSGPGVNDETAASGEGTVVIGGPGSSSGGGSGSGGGGGSHSGGSSDSSIVESGSSANEEDETSDGTSTTDPEQGNIPAAGGDQETGESQENNDPQGGETGENNKNEESADAEENGNQNPEGGDDTTTDGSLTDDTDDNQSEGNDNSTSAGDSEKGNSEEGGTEDKGEDSNDTGSNGQESSNEGSDSNTSGDPQDDAGEAGGGDGAEGGSVAAVSYHKTYLVAATPSDAEEDEKKVASPSDASDSNADENMLDGMVYDTVLMDGKAVVAFTITFADLAMDDVDLEELATDSDAIRVYRMELEDVSVEVRALKGTFPENVELEVTKLSEGDEKYEATKEALNDSGVQYAGLLAYDVTFYDEDGNEIEPDGDVSVALELKKQALDSYVDLNSLTVQHLKETEDGIKVEAVADVNNDTAGTVEVNEENLITAKFGLDSFSVLAVPLPADSCTVTGVAISNEILTSGSLAAVVDTVEGAGSLVHAQYQWYVSDTGANGPWTEIPDTTTVNSKEAAYYVARDGARKWFKVKVTGTDGEFKESEGYQVKYYDELKNGSFEKPVVDVDEDGFHSYYTQDDMKYVGQYPNGKWVGSGSHFLDVVNGPDGTSEVEWKTSAWGLEYDNKDENNKDYYIEIVDASSDKVYQYLRSGQIMETTNSSHKAYNISSAAEGTQFAELNCEEPGALYQDILTQPGSTLYWGLSHAGRDHEDTMAVVISSTNEILAKEAEDGKVWNPGKYSDLGGRKEDIRRIITSPAGTWERYTGSYTVPEGQYVTRFYFVAVVDESQYGDTEAERKRLEYDLTHGNLLDAVTFGKDVPPLLEQTGDLVINKEVDGIGKQDVPDKSFEFTITKSGDWNPTRTVRLPNDGNWSVKVDDLVPGNYTVTEIQPDNLEGYEYLGTTYSIENNEVKKGTVTNIAVVKNTSKDVTFTNKYKSKTQIEIKKKVDGYLGDRDKKFEFTATLKENGKPIDFPQGASTNSGYTVDGKTATFYLGNDDTVTLTDLPVEATLTITETNENYTVTVEQGKELLVKNKNFVEVTLDETNDLVLFTNTYNGLIDTGVLLDSLPYVLILAAVAAGVAFFVIRKRREDESDLD